MGNITRGTSFYLLLCGSDSRVSHFELHSGREESFLIPAFYGNIYYIQKTMNAWGVLLFIFKKGEKYHYIEKSVFFLLRC